MSKRKIGQRAEVLLDTIDLEILNILGKHNPKTRGKYNEYNGMQVLQLAEAVKIQHNSLKPHLDKLRYLGLINSRKNSEGKVILGLSLEFFKEIEEGDFASQKEYKKILLEVENQEALIIYMNKIKEFLENKEMEKEIEFDLRKKKDIPLKAKNGLKATKPIIK